MSKNIRSEPSNNFGKHLNINLLINEFQQVIILN